MLKYHFLEVNMKTYLFHILILGFLVTLFVSASFSWTADIHEAVASGDLKAIQTILEKNPRLLEARSPDNLTPLLLASVLGRTEIVGFLIEKGADIDAGDNNRMTPLHFAASYGRPECAHLLLEKGADVNAREVNGRTPLFFNARQGNEQIFQLLLDKGATVDVYNNFKRGPLLYALWGGHEKLARLLISKGADVNKKDTTGYSPLHQMCIDGRTDLAKLLIAEGADIELADSHDLSPLSLAAYYNRGDLVAYLVETGAKADRTDSNSDTALHGAAWHGNTKAAAALLDKNAGHNAKNDQGRTPPDYAIMAGQSEAVQFLKDRGGQPSSKDIKSMGGQEVPANIGQGETKPITMTVLYDNYVAAEGTKAEWGFSCLIQGTKDTILFDTGGNPDTFRHNVQHLAVDLQAADAVVLSHEHWDHIGGLPVVFETNTHAPLYIPFSFPYDFVRQVEVSGAKVVPVNEAVAVCDHVYLTGQMGESIKEQSLIVNTPLGLIIVTGCSHQGIVNILKRAKEILNRDIYLVFGGFHLMRHSEEQVEAIIKDFRELGVKKCGATHCTGDQAIQLFRNAYGDDYVEIGSGRILRFGKKGLQ